MRNLVLVAAVGVALPGGAPADASARTADFCQEDPATHGDGTTVRMVDDCFVPTVLRGPSGATIGFVNEDPEPHTITGVGPWGTGHDEVPPDSNIQILFPQDGVFVYTCLLHPGMTGAIVIGGASGPGAAQEPPIEVEEAETPEEPPPQEAPVEADGEGLPSIWLAAALAVGLLIGILVGRLTRRRAR
jgi:plastocyanin